MSITHAMLIWNNTNTIVALFLERDDKEEESEKKVCIKIQVSIIILFRQIPYFINLHKVKLVIKILMGFEKQAVFKVINNNKLYNYKCLCFILIFCQFSVAQRLI